MLHRPTTLMTTRQASRSLMHLMALLILALLLLAPFSVRTASAAPLATGDWFLLLDEQFDGTTLDHSRWHTCYFWAEDGCTNEGNNELQWYQRDDVLVENGLLRLRAQQRSINGFSYTSGMISSDRGFYFQYGYLEVRARIPAGRGLWPAIWMLPAPDNGSRPEVDVMEILGHEPNKAYMTFHYRDTSEDGLGRAQNETVGVDLSQDYHTFALDWQPDRLTWYIDDVEQFSVTQNVPQEPMYILANLAVGGDWPGSPDEMTQFPSYYDLDYIRVWQRPEHFLSSQG